MEPISTIIVTALAAGAAAGLTDAASQAVKDAYAGLKDLIKRKYAKAGAGVDILETDPASEDLRSFAGKQLAASGAAEDPDVQKLAQALLEAVKTHDPGIAPVVGVRLADIEAAGLRLKDIEARGVGSVTGVEVSRARFTGDIIDISGVRAVGGMPAPPAPAPSKVKVLILAANPVDTPALRLGEEMRAIDAALQAGTQRDAFDLEQAHALQVGDLQSLLQRHRPHIVHFSGHGAPTGEIILQDEAGRACVVPPGALADLFALLKDNIRCVVLNACFSRQQAAAIAQHIDCVVGMSAEIGDAPARAFAASFYEALAYGRNVKTAFELGCNRIDLSGLPDDDVPQLLAPKGDPALVTFAGR